VRCNEYVQEEEEIQSLQKTISQMEAELDEEQNRLAEATTKLENSEKQLQKVSQTASILAIRGVRIVTGEIRSRSV